MRRDWGALPLIREKLSLELSYKPISLVHDSNLWHQSPGLWSKMASIGHRSGVLEAQLEQLSDV